MINNWLVFALLAFVSTVLVGVYHTIAARIGWVDKPDSRSSHRHATVSGTGIVLAAIFAGFTLFLLLSDQIALATAWLFLVASSVAILGWLDDRYHLSIGLRFIAYAVFAVLVVVLVGVQPTVAAIAAMLFVLAHVNLFNFMDGIDGLAIGQVIFCCGASVWLTPSGVPTELAPLSLGLAAIGLGALVWNWSPAKIFLGDAGSIFFGLSLAIFAVFSAAEESLHFVTWLILFALFICDSTLTLVARMFAGEKVYQAHRTHVYQLAARRLDSHAAVTCGYMLINLAFLLPLSMLAEHYSTWRYYYLSIAYAPLIIIGHSYRKRLLCFQADKL